MASSSIRNSSSSRAVVGGLNLSGKIFFGSLCAGTLYLGTWQTRRYFDKMDLIEQRTRELAEEPVPLVVNTGSAKTTTATGFRRCLVEGRFRHENEMLLGPRGPPLGALAASGQASGRSEGGMSSGPQGYFVITPFETTMGRTLLVNRGWIPREFPKAGTSFDHPAGVVKIVAVQGKGEKPRFMVPQHDLSTRPPRFYWMDQETMEDIAGIDNGESLVIVQVKSDNGELQYPAQPPADAVGDFKTTPMVHVAYAVTWYSLAAAGLVMTRKLITRGRA